MALPAGTLVQLWIDGCSVAEWPTQSILCRSQDLPRRIVLQINLCWIDRCHKSPFAITSFWAKYQSHGWQSVSQLQYVFLAMIRKLKKQGLDNTQHHQSMSQTELDTIRQSFDLSSPKILQHKVWFELTIGFARRGVENLRELKPSAFNVHTDSR